MKHYYAAHKCANNEIAIFNSKEERDKWVNHEDYFSEMIAKDDEIFFNDERISLSESEAYSFIGKQLHNTKEYIKDNILENVMWAFSTPSMLGGKM